MLDYPPGGVVWIACPLFLCPHAPAFAAYIHASAPARRMSPAQVRKPWANLAHGIRSAVGGDTLYLQKVVYSRLNGKNLRFESPDSEIAHFFDLETHSTKSTSAIPLNPPLHCWVMPLSNLGVPGEYGTRRQCLRACEGRRWTNRLQLLILQHANSLQTSCSSHAQFGSATRESGR
jgi:hypothetical protein